MIIVRDHLILVTLKLELTLLQYTRILSIKFSANAVISLLDGDHPHICEIQQCSYKKTVLFLFVILISFFDTSCAFLLSKRIIGENVNIVATWVLKYYQLFYLLEFFKEDVFSFVQWLLMFQHDELL